MPADVKSAPAANRAASLEGSVFTCQSERDRVEAIDQAFDYRGDVTLDVRGERVEGYIFNRQAGATLADSFLQFFPADAANQRTVSYADIDRVEFTGKDRAAGKQWEDWIRKYNEKKAAGEKNIALAPEALD